MKKTVVILGVLAILFLAAGAAVAADAGGVKATLSLKTWYNSWEEENEGESTSDFGSAWMLGPALTIRFDKVILGASYLISLEGYEPEGGNLTYDRNDLDLTLTYMFSPRFGAFAGYKYIDSPVSFTEGGDDYAKKTIAGPGLGITGNVPLGQAAALYGSLAFLWVNKDYDYDSEDNDDFSFDMLGASLDLGLAYAFSPSFSATVGLKGQRFDGDDDAGFNHTSTFTGLTAGVNYTF